MLYVENISMAPKSQEVSHMHQNMINKNQANQANIQGAFAQEIRHNSQQTVKSGKTDNEEYAYDAKEKRQNQSKKNQQERQKEDEKKEIKLSSFDIKI